MKKRILRFALSMLGAFLFLYIAGIIRDYKLLTDHVIRMHVVGASDEEADQELKLQVRDAVQSVLQPLLSQAQDDAEARSILQENLPLLQETATQAAQGQAVSVSLAQESFPTREYDDFSLPAGRYTTLRITIGAGAGHNWWCVVFPAFCYGDLEEGTAKLGASEDLLPTLRREGTYEVRFGLMDLLGRLFS